MKRIFIKLFLIVAIVCMISSCNLVPEKATSVDKAMLFSQQASQTYLTLYNTYKGLDNSLSGDKLQRLHTQVAPILNQAKYVLIRYNKTVIAWKRSGKVNTDALYKDKATFYTLVEDAQKLLMLYTSRGVE